MVGARQRRRASHVHGPQAQLSENQREQFEAPVKVATSLVILEGGGITELDTGQRMCAKVRQERAQTQ